MQLSEANTLHISRVKPGNQRDGDSGGREGRREREGGRGGEGGGRGGREGWNPSKAG